MVLEVVFLEGLVEGGEPIDEEEILISSRTVWREEKATIVFGLGDLYV